MTPIQRFVWPNWSSYDFPLAAKKDPEIKAAVIDQLFDLATAMKKGFTREDITAAAEDMLARPTYEVKA